MDKKSGVTAKFYSNTHLLVFISITCFSSSIPGIFWCLIEKENIQFDAPIKERQLKAVRYLKNISIKSTITY